MPARLVNWQTQLSVLMEKMLQIVSNFFTNKNFNFSCCLVSLLAARALKELEEVRRVSCHSNGDSRSMLIRGEPRIGGKNANVSSVFHQVGRILLNSKQNKLIKKDDLFAGAGPTLPFPRSPVVQYITIKILNIFNDSLR